TEAEHGDLAILVHVLEPDAARASPTVPTTTIATTATTATTAAAARRNRDRQNARDEPQDSIHPRTPSELPPSRHEARRRLVFADSRRGSSKEGFLAPCL